MKRRIGAVLTAAGLACLMAMPMAMAHDDGGVDEAWSNEMNQETYWEARFGPGTECTKYEPHNGFIPAQYEIAVSKGGTKVRVYNPAPDNDFILGPRNTQGGNADKDKHHDISWVMKCNVETPQTTTTVAETTTTTEEETTTTTVETTTTTTPETTTTTVVQTTTTVPEETTTTAPEVTTTTVTEETTTTVTEETTTTAPDEPEEELPFTGPREDAIKLAVLGTGLLAGGGAMVWLGRKEDAAA